MEIALLDDIVEKFQLSIAVNPNGTDKAHPKLYTSNVYENIFKTIKNSNIRILEIGIRTGASLKLWSEYFLEAEIWGIDISDDGVVPEFVKNPRINIKYADAYSDEFLINLGLSFDIIIDDGPHSLNSQIFAVQNFTKMLNPGGFLFIEDIIGGKPYVDKIMSKINKLEKLEVKVFDLRKLTGVNDSIIVAVHRNELGSESYWGAKIQYFALYTRISIYKLLELVGIRRFGL
jgi:SAM-dependent methyltransferase